MRIAVVCPYALDRPGGVQQQAEDLVGRLRRRDHDAWLVGPGESPLPGTRTLGPTVPIPANRSVAPIGIDPRVGSRLRRAVTDADIVHVHEPLLPLVSWAALNTKGPPIVGTFHADPPRWVRESLRLARGMARRRLARLSAATAVSPVAAEAVVDLVDDVVTIPNAIDSALYRDGDRDPKRVAFLGRDEKRKGLDVLLAAWPAVRRAIPESELVVMGAIRSGSIGGVRFIGPVDDVTKRDGLGSAALYCAPNLGGESFGMTVLEAMASGCAVIASELPGFRFVAGETARFVAPGDAAELSRGLIELLGAPEEKAKLGSAAQKRARRFDWTEIVPRYEAVYQQLLRSN